MSHVFYQGKTIDLNDNESRADYLLETELAKVFVDHKSERMKIHTINFVTDDDGFKPTQTAIMMKTFSRRDNSIENGLNDNDANIDINKNNETHMKAKSIIPMFVRTQKQTTLPYCYKENINGKSVNNSRSKSYRLELINLNNEPTNGVHLEGIHSNTTRNKSNNANTSLYTATKDQTIKKSDNFSKHCCHLYSETGHILQRYCVQPFKLIYHGIFSKSNESDGDQSDQPLLRYNLTVRVTDRDIERTSIKSQNVHLSSLRRYRYQLQLNHIRNFLRDTTETVISVFRREIVISNININIFGKRSTQGIPNDNDYV